MGKSNPKKTNGKKESSVRKETDIEFKPRPELLLHPNVPRPLHGLNPRTIFGKSWWDKVRIKTYESTGYHCAACGVHKSKAKFRNLLDAHEVYEIDYRNGTAHFIEVVPLCYLCHAYIHDGRQDGLLSQGQQSHRLFVQIIKHGDSVLRAAGLERPTLNQREQQIAIMMEERTLCPWKNWRLWIGGKSYKPLYKNESEWEAAHK